MNLSELARLVASAGADACLPKASVKPLLALVDSKDAAVRNGSLDVLMAAYGDLGSAAKL
jgi:hypothetical protein